MPIHASGRSRRRTRGAAPRTLRRDAPEPPPLALLTDTRLERYWLPGHDLRRRSALFRRNEKFLRDELRLPCWVCRTRGSP